MHQAERPLLAIALRLAAMSMLSTMFMFMKLLGENGVSMPETIFWRQAMSVPLLLGWLFATGRLRLLATRRLKAHATRSVIGTMGLVCNVGAAVLLPLPVATTLGFTGPLFAVLITALVLHQTVGKWRWTAVALGFAGVLIIAQPGSSDIPPMGLVFGLGAGVVVATVSFQIRDLARTDAPIACVFWFAMFGALITAALLPFYSQPHEPRVWLLLVGTGAAGTLAQTLMTTSLRYGQVATVVVMDYTSLIWSTTWGWLIFADLPPTATWLGAPVIITAGIIITWREHVLARNISATSALDEGSIEQASARSRGT
ncbi:MULTISPECIES: DMT family transporter [Novosphingobium]|uniref:Permease of the drug/metabolite transporter (DMT) superfamily n=1 Tax=Novosphingobium mathurense TaxID=428990 RepID=A0A1U6H196_9SPHN|nr:MULTISPECIES: DMT family transporter [Novosphingobium]CDO34801.1 conserved membrane hypothetical protein [Novosphingobium sp. KN65.2]SLJ89497.1 Permease of the drug/metabolite transporter (DMT) superfamily [Novosphingobium mathurense]